MIGRGTGLSFTTEWEDGTRSNENDLIQKIDI